MLYADRRGGRKLHDLGNTTRPTHDPAQGLLGWASTIDDVKRGQAANVPAANQRVRARNVLPGMLGERQVRPSGVAPRSQAMTGGSTPVSQTLPAQPLARPRANAGPLPRVAHGPTFAQKAKRAATTRIAGRL